MRIFSRTVSSDKAPPRRDKPCPCDMPWCASGKEARGNRDRDDRDAKAARR